MQIVIISILVIVFVINIVSHFSNLSILVKLCYNENSTTDFWKLFLKHCISAESKYSSILMIIIALILFPFFFIFIQYKKRYYPDARIEIESTNTSINHNDFQYDIQYYENMPISDGQYFHTNASDFQLLSPKIKITGNLMVDTNNYIGEIVRYAFEKKLPVNYELSKIIKLNDDSKLTLPALLYLNNEDIPVFFIYNSQQRNQFNKLKTQLKKNSPFKRVMYFSIPEIQSI